MNKITKKILKEGVKLKEGEFNDLDNNTNEYEQGKEVKETNDIFNREFIISTMKNLVNFVSEKLTSIKSETVMGNKYLEFKADDYKNKISKDCVENMKFKREENTLIFYGLPKFKKDKSGSFEIESFENEISVLKNTAIDYSTPEELSEYLFGTLLSEEIL